MHTKDNVGSFAPGTPPLQGASTDLGLLVMALIWGINFPLIKSALAEFSPLAFNALRFPLAALTVLLILGMRKGIPWPDRRDWPRVVALGLVGNVVYQGFFIFGLDGTLAGNASILLATTPVWTIFLSTFLGHESPGPLVWTGVVATLTGMVLVVVGGTATVSVGGSTLVGDLLILGGAFTWSVYSVGCRRLIERYGSVPVTAWTLWVGTAGLVILGLPSLAQLELRDTSPLGWWGVVYAGVLAIGLAYLLWYRGVQRIGNSRTAAYSNLTPIVALVVAWLWLNEVPSLLQITGAIVVLGGLTLARLGRSRSA